MWLQITPVFAGISVLRWASTAREVTVLVLVGAGGISVNFGPR